MSRPLHRSAVLPRPGLGTPPVPRPPAPERWTTPAGLRGLAVRLPTLPQVALRLILPAGSAADPAGAAGLASLVGSMLTEGSQGLSAEELNRRLDRIGASLSVQVGHDFAEIDLLSLSETLPEALELLGQVVVHPAFPAAELERVRAETLDALEARLDEPANVADDAIGEALFGDAHPYGQLPLGTLESVSELSRESLVDFHATYYRPAGAVVIAAGDVEPAALGDLLATVFAGWEGAGAAVTYPAETTAALRAGERVRVPWEDARQSEIRVGGLGMRRNSPDWIPAAVANYLLGGSTITGRLGANLREEKGWTYGVRSGFSANLRIGGWAIETAVDAEVAEAALAEIRGELVRFLAEPVPEAELRRAKDALILSLPRAFETPGRIVSRLAAVEVFGLREDYWESFAARVEAVDRDEILRIAHACFDPARLAAVTVGG